MSPRSFARVCPRCGVNTIRGRSGTVCGDCQPKVDAERRARGRTLDTKRRSDKPWRKIYSDRRWKALARRTIREEPICRRCRRAASKVADHIVPLGPPFWGAPFDRANTQGLCVACNRVKAEEDARKARERGDGP